MANPAPAIKNETLLSAEKRISGEGSDSVLPLLDFSEVLPGSNCNSKAVVVHFLLKECVQTALLLWLLVLELLDVWVLGVDFLGHLCNLIILSWCVLLEVVLILLHIAVAHIRILVNKFVLEVLVKSVKNDSKRLNDSWSIANRHWRWHFCYFAELCDFWSSRVIAHLSRLLAELPEVTFNVFTHDVVVLANRTSGRRRVLGLVGLLADRLLIRSLRV